MIVFDKFFFNGFNTLNSMVILVKNQINHNFFHDFLLFFINLNLFPIILFQKYLIIFLNTLMFILSIVFSLITLNLLKMLIDKLKIHFQ